MIFVIILGLGIGLGIFLISTAYGYNFEFEEKRILQTPTICTIPPDDPLITEQVKKNYLKQTKDAVLEWQYQLQVEAKKPANWKINYLEGEYPMCDITIKFKKHYDENMSPDYYDVLGSYSDGIIEIYFQDFSTCHSSQLEWCENDIATAREIFITIQHEFGHALGLGHTSEESIMKPVTDGINDHNKITDYDIKTVQRIYGIDGFNSYKGELAPWIMQSAKKYKFDIISDSEFLDVIRHLINIEKIHVKQNMVKNNDYVPIWFKNNAGWWTDGKITDKEFLNGMEYLVNRGIIKVN